MSAVLQQAIANDVGFSTPEFEPVSISSIVERHHDALLTFLRRRLAIAEDAFDLAQEAYIRMLRYEGSRAIESPEALLFRIAANVATDHVRAAHTRQLSNYLQVEDVDLQSEHPTAERTIEAEQSLELLLAVVDNLPTKCKQVFLLSRASGLTYPQIAERCGISVKMVEKHVSHALTSCLAAVS